VATGADATALAVLAMALARTLCRGLLPGSLAGHLARRLAGGHGVGCLAGGLVAGARAVVATTAGGKTKFELESRLLLVRLSGKVWGGVGGSNLAIEREHRGCSGRRGGGGGDDSGGEEHGGGATCFDDERTLEVVGEGREHGACGRRGRCRGQSPKVAGSRRKSPKVALCTFTHCFVGQEDKSGDR